MTALQYLKSIEHPQKMQMVALDKLVRKLVSGARPVLYQNSIIGYGVYEYTYKTGRTGKWFVFGFAPRKGYVSLYSTAITENAYLAEEFRKEMGGLKGGKSCINIKDLHGLEDGALKRLIVTSFKEMKSYCKKQGWPFSLS